MKLRSSQFVSIKQNMISSSFNSYFTVIRRKSLNVKQNFPMHPMEKCATSNRNLCQHIRKVQKHPHLCYQSLAFGYMTSPRGRCAEAIILKFNFSLLSCATCPADRRIQLLNHDGTNQHPDNALFGGRHHLSAETSLPEPDRSVPSPLLYSWGLGWEDHVSERSTN